MGKVGHPASLMSDALRRHVERELLNDLAHYRPAAPGETLLFDWSNPCQEGHCVRALDGLLESMSDVAVRDQNGNVIAEGWIDFVNAGEVETDSPFDHAADGSLLAHIVGDFVAGPGFARVRSMLDRFHDAYERGDVQAASHLHDAIDRIGMRATDLNGIQYDVSVVYFQQGALLFTVSRKAPL